VYSWLRRHSPQDFPSPKRADQDPPDELSFSFVLERSENPSLRVGPVFSPAYGTQCAPRDFLREFVDLAEVAPAFLERRYYLTPLKEATKANHLLAHVMEKTRRAGIATFVMRDREYLIAIFAENGILCAETLRFHDEITSPEDIGLVNAVPVPRQRVSAFERAIDALSKTALAQGALVDEDTKRLRAVIDKKKRAGKDLIHIDREVADAETEEDDGDIDLLATIRQSLRHAGKRRK
jgi:DNA end-binding protein Ku